MPRRSKASGCAIGPSISWCSRARVAAYLQEKRGGARTDLAQRSGSAGFAGDAYPASLGAVAGGVQSHSTRAALAPPLPRTSRTAWSRSAALVPGAASVKRPSWATTSSGRGAERCRAAARQTRCTSRPLNPAVRYRRRRHTPLAAAVSRGHGVERRVATAYPRKQQGRGWPVVHIGGHPPLKQGPPVGPARLQQSGRQRGQCTGKRMWAGAAGPPRTTSAG